MGIADSVAIFGDVVATDVLRFTRNPTDLDSGGWWAVTQTFEGDFLAFEFGTVTRGVDVSHFAGPFDGVPTDSWTSTQSQNEYESGVRSIHDDISRGWVYQVNLCRQLCAPLGVNHDPIGLYMNLLKLNPAPYAGAIRVFARDSGLEQDVFVVSASPELFLSIKGDVIKSRPIKGTSATADGFLDKDKSENIMIVDLVRNDLSHICVPGSVHVPALLAPEAHPGLYHLVSDIEGTLIPGTGWSQILVSTAPPGSVSGAPKSSALEVISRLERVKRSYYCGALGWVDTDESQAQLAVAIRTFWFTHNASGPFLNFGTGAGITWDSEPAQEWKETELKARHLLNVASARYAKSEDK